MDQRHNLEKSYLALIEFLLLSKKNMAIIGEKYGVSPIQAITLLLLNEPRPMHSFTKIFNCDPSNTTGIVDGLEKKKLVGRIESSDDRRVKMIKIKAKGRAVRDSIITKLTDDDSFIMKKLTHDEVNTFVMLINKITS